MYLSGRFEFRLDVGHWEEKINGRSANIIGLGQVPRRVLAIEGTDPLYLFWNQGKLKHQYISIQNAIVNCISENHFLASPLHSTSCEERLSSPGEKNEPSSHSIAKELSHISPCVQHEQSSR
jgi:hypothetical protein